MPTLYIPKPRTFDGLISQLKTLKAINPESYSALQGQYKTAKLAILPTSNIPEEKPDDITFLQLTAFALKNEFFMLEIEKRYANLKETMPHRKERHELSEWQREIKAEASLEQRGINIDGRKDFTRLLHQRLLNKLKKSNPTATGQDVLRKLQQDATTLHRMLTPSTQISREEKGITETPYNMEKFLDNPPDIIFAMGNNDLRQMDFIAKLYHAAKAASPEKYCKMYVSGYGGHGTMHDPVFALQEGQTMVQRLIDLGIDPNDIRVEHDAVDTGRNVKYMDIYIEIETTVKEKEFFKSINLLNDEDAEFLEKMLALPAHLKRTPAEEEKLAAILAPIHQYIIENKISIFNNILVSGTPGGLRRQTSTLEQQKILPWTTITCLTPFEFSENFSENYYYSNLPRALINFIYALREVASYLDYTTNTEFLSKRALPDAENLKACIRLYAEYYNLMREEKYNLQSQPLFLEPRINGDKLAEAFIAFSQQKSRDEKNTAAITKLNKAIQPTADYFRRAFLDVEIEKLQQISLRWKITPRAQTRELDTGGTYSRQDLISYPFFKFPTKKPPLIKSGLAMAENTTPKPG